MFLICGCNLDQDSNVQVSICMDPYQDSNVAFNEIGKKATYGLTVNPAHL